MIPRAMIAAWEVSAKAERGIPMGYDLNSSIALARPFLHSQHGLAMRRRNYPGR
jgi:hypothetical protein